MTRTIIILLIACSTLTSCLDDAEDSASALEQSPVRAITNDSFFDDNGTPIGTPHGDNFTIKSASLIGSAVNIEVEYSGGCENHEFELIFNSANQNAQGTPKSFVLVHDDNEDPCEALLTENIIIQLPSNINNGGGQADNSVNIFNGYNGAFHTTSDSWSSSVPQSNDCVIRNSKLEVFNSCAWSLLNDKAFFQVNPKDWDRHLIPVEVADGVSLEGLILTEYDLGVTVLTEYTIPDSIVTCLALDPNGIPVRINCITTPSGR